MQKRNITEILRMTKEKIEETSGEAPPFFFAVPLGLPPLGFECRKAGRSYPGQDCLKDILEKLSEMQHLAVLIIVRQGDFLFVAEGTNKKLTVWELKLYRSPGFTLVDEWKRSETTIFDAIKPRLV